jgi:hypothetical protein
MILFMPVIIFLWMVGWSLFWAGSESKPQRNKATADNDLSFTCIQYEDELARYN